MDKNATALMGSNEAVELLHPKAASETNLREEELKMEKKEGGNRPAQFEAM